MNRLVLLASLVCSLSITVWAQTADTSVGTAGLADILSGIKAAIQRNLGRPYVWGATGEKSYDCSGFVWKVLSENGVLLKRSTARKYYMMLKPALKEEQGNFGTLIFFDDLKHVGIVDTPQAFYHAQTGTGTVRSEMTAFWKKKTSGFRRLPL